jgi:hypothetical protein
VVATTANAPKTSSLAVLPFALDQKAEDAFSPIAIFDPSAPRSATLRPILHCRICGFVPLFHLLAGDLVDTYPADRRTMTF